MTEGEKKGSEGGRESRGHTSRDSEGKMKGQVERKRETEVEQRLCDVPRTLLSDPVGLRRVDGCYVRHATETLSWFGLELIS